MHGYNAPPVKRTHCQQPDRDAPRLKCGYPLPCPWHTAIIDATATPATVTIPTTAHAARRAAPHMHAIARALEDK